MAAEILAYALVISVPSLCLAKRTPEQTCLQGRHLLPSSRKNGMIGRPEGARLGGPTSVKAGKPEEQHVHHPPRPGTGPGCHQVPHP